LGWFKYAFCYQVVKLPFNFFMRAYGTNLSLLKCGWEPSSTRNTAPCFYKIASKDCKQYNNYLLPVKSDAVYCPTGLVHPPLQLGVANSLPGFRDSLPHPISQPQKLAYLPNFFPSHCFLKLDSYTHERAAPVSTSIDMGRSSIDHPSSTITVKLRSSVSTDSGI